MTPGKGGNTIRQLEEGVPTEERQGVREYSGWGQAENRIRKLRGAA